MPPELWELLKVYGVAAFPMAFVTFNWWLERGDRKQAQAELVQTLREVTATVRESTGTSQLTAQLIGALAKPQSAK